MPEHSISFNRQSPPDPSDPRKVPAGMLFVPVSRGGRAYIVWKIAEVINLSEQTEIKHHPYVLEMLISPSDARSFAESLLDIANRIEPAP
jgi:hypothetical protein